MRSLAPTVLAVALLSACSSSSGGTASPASPANSTNSQSASGRASPIPPPNLKTQLLTAAELPEGWAVDNSAKSNNGSTPSCFKTLKPRLRTQTKAEANFVKGTSVPVFQQSLGYYDTAAKVLTTFRAATHVLNNCQRVSFTTNGTKVTGSIGQLSFPKFGDRSGAWQLVLSGEGLTVGFDAVLVEKGRELALLLYGDLGTPDLLEAKTLARKAVAKMPAN